MVSGKRGTYLVHLDGDSRASLDGALAPWAGCAGVAAHVGRRDVRHGGVGRREAGALGAIVDAVDPEVLEGGVGGRLLGPQGCQDGKGGRLHGREA